MSAKVAEIITRQVTPEMSRLCGATEGEVGEVLQEGTELTAGMSRGSGVMGWCLGRKVRHDEIGEEAEARADGEAHREIEIFAQHPEIGSVQPYVTSCLDFDELTSSRGPASRVRAWADTAAENLGIGFLSNDFAISGVGRFWKGPEMALVVGKKGHTHGGSGLIKSVEQSLECCRRREDVVVQNPPVGCLGNDRESLFFGRSQTGTAARVIS